MTDMTDDQVRALLDGATPGRRVQFHGSYCPEAVGTPFSDWDTSHDVSVIRPDGSRYRLAHYKHASDAYLSQMAPVLARALLDTRAELARVKADAAAAQALVGTLTGAAQRLNAACDAMWNDHRRVEAHRIKECHMKAISEAQQALFPALAQTPTDPGDGWTWNERLGWIGPDGKPADPRRRG